MRRVFVIFSLFFYTAIFSFDATIPLLDLNDYYSEETKSKFLTELKEAVTEVGFFALINTGVNKEVLEKAFSESEKFFKLSLEEKTTCLNKKLNGQRGFVLSESAKGDSRMDHKQFYHIGRECSEKEREEQGILWGNVWPEKYPEFKKASLDLFSSLQTYMQPIENAFAEVLGLRKETFHEMTRSGDLLMRLLYYPKNPPENTIWGAEHTDIDLYTILPRSTAKGLQVLNKDGTWVNVLVPDGAFVINVGDYLENLSNGLCKSARHRIVDPGLGQERFSIVFFVHTTSDTRLDPLETCIKESGGVRKYANVNRYQLLSERLIDLRIASDEMMNDFVNSDAIENLMEVGRFSEKASQELRLAAEHFRLNDEAKENLSRLGVYP